MTIWVTFCPHYWFYCLSSKGLTKFTVIAWRHRRFAKKCAAWCRHRGIDVHDLVKSGDRKQEALICDVEWRHGQMRDCLDWSLPCLPGALLMKKFACVLLRNTRNGWLATSGRIRQACGRPWWDGLSVKSLFWIGFFTVAGKGKWHNSFGLLTVTLSGQLVSLSCRVFVFRPSV